ncbi:hypothetical protein NDQ71_05460 [Pseudoalteromonas sp. KG3]|uniref:Uncharacterized protein n=1 Tax=Pseudoalteromonas prydzensis TaxID=182141 RepID=A0ABR9FR53_9GAMM|nr:MULTISPECIES: hypothetical protein [Pseudoalteromonas]MBE0459322.1 hypothetical protein [Pseudoalteromonas prydzensis]WKD24521.1 hypothetical protein NDQ71_05460 [Pseudoalteromonas sp. KG3]
MLKRKKLIIAYLLIVLPLLDSLLIPPAFGLQWHNAKTMYLFSAYLIPIKLLFVTIGGFLLVKQDRQHHEQPRVWYRKLVDGLIFIVAGVQFIVLAIISGLYLVVGTQADDYQQQGNISVYTSDIGAFGKATHYFSYQCSDDNGFYTLTPIVTLDWLGHFTFSEKGTVLIINHNAHTDKGGQVKQIDLTGFACK